MHPSVPLVKVLENVPRGQGSNEVTSSLSSSILVNPEAKRAEFKYRPSSEKGCGMRIASALEFTGFLGDDKLLVNKARKYSSH